MLSITWPQVKFGPLLRGEYDARFYHNIFTNKPDEVGGLRKVWLQYLAKPEIAVFDGPDGYFQKLNGWDEFLRKELYSIIRNRWLRKIEKFANPAPVGMHVRRGDFADPEKEEDFIYRGSLKTPISWFIQSLNAIRDMADRRVKAFVVSDGTDKELRPLLSVGGVILIRTGSAISDLMVLSKARILVASGGSTFSAWASFFGQMPTISYPGQSLTWFNLKNKNGYYIGEFDPGLPPEEFICQTKEVFSEKAGV